MLLCGVEARETGPAPRLTRTFEPRWVWVLLEGVGPCTAVCSTLHRGPAAGYWRAEGVLHGFVVNDDDDWVLDTKLSAERWRTRARGR